MSRFVLLAPLSVQVGRDQGCAPALSGCGPQASVQHGLPFRGAMLGKAIGPLGDVRDCCGRGGPSGLADARAAEL